MAWVKLDDQFFAHPKVIDLSKDAKLLFLAGLAHCAAQLTDGAISQGALRVIAATVDVDRVVAGELVNAGLWLTTSTGYTVHDYLDYNPTADQVKHERAATAQRVANWRQRHQDRDVSNGVTSGVSNAVSTPPPVPVPDPVPISISRERENARASTGSVAATAHHNEPLSLSLVASQLPEPETRAEPEAAPVATADIPDPLAERDRNHALYDAWCAATGYTPKTSGERKSWLKALAGMHNEVGLSPPGCGPLVGQYRAKMGNDKQPTPGQVSAMYSQLGVSPHVVSQLYAVGQHYAQHPAAPPESPDDRARRVRASRVAAGLRVPPKPELDNLGTP